MIQDEFTGLFYEPTKIKNRQKLKIYENIKNEIHELKSLINNLKIMNNNIIKKGSDFEVEPFWERGLNPITMYSIKEISNRKENNKRRKEKYKQLKNSI